jgi:acetyltransferase-like isoleucine patch superfamily enzyme
VQRNPVVVGDGVWLGARSIILPGVTIGEGSIVNPGAVVNKDVAANTRVGGIPATQLEVLGTNEAADV